jgi:endonuclease III
MNDGNIIAGNILAAMSKDILDKYNGVISENWEAIKEFHSVGPKIASVVAYEPFGINHVPVDVEILWVVVP